jgi:hypothetical protein
MTVLDRALARLRAMGARVPGLERQPMPFPPGHFYSPIPDQEEVRRHRARIFDRSRRPLGGVDLREAEQLALVEQLARFYPDLPFPDQQTPGVRYWYQNTFYSYGDAILLYGMLRHLAPRRVIEVGAGFTSAVVLDTNDRFLDHRIQSTMIEPFPDTLRTVTAGFAQDYELIPQRVQDVPVEFFGALGANDLLLIDSTHVSKVGSDVNYLVFEVLPRLEPGVYVHFHDVFYPFEYPASWVEQGFAWNEDYLLRAFLQFNRAFEIVLFNAFLAEFHLQATTRALPLFARNPGGSLWLRRVA